MPKAEQGETVFRISQPYRAFAYAFAASGILTALYLLAKTRDPLSLGPLALGLAFLAIVVRSFGVAISSEGWSEITLRGTRRWFSWKEVEDVEVGSVHAHLLRNDGKISTIKLHVFERPEAAGQAIIEWFEASKVQGADPDLSLDKTPGS